MPGVVHDRGDAVNDRQRPVALFRYSLIGEAAEASLTKRDGLRGYASWPAVTRRTASRRSPPLPGPASPGPPPLLAVAELPPSAEGGLPSGERLVIGVVQNPTSPAERLRQPP